MLNNLAPIGLSTYSRLGHLKQTVEALQENELASESKLYIFSDAPKLGDEDKVKAVRAYLKTINGFQEIHIYEREENNRVANNRGGMRMLLEKFGKMIFLEEDVVTSPNFLSFMNKALNFYMYDHRVFAVNGYTLPITIPDDYNLDVIAMPRMFAWGFGIWLDRFEKIEMNITPKMYNGIIRCPQKKTAYIKGGGNILAQLKLIADGEIEALDVRIDYSMFVEGEKFVIAPKQSLVRNIGADGSGEHWKIKTNKFDVGLNSASISTVFSHNISFDNRILSQVKKRLPYTWKHHVKFFLRRFVKCSIR